MKIKLKFFGFPEMEKKIGGKEIDLDLDGRTYGDPYRKRKVLLLCRKVLRSLKPLRD